MSLKMVDDFQKLVDAIDSLVAKEEKAAKYNLIIDDQAILSTKKLPKPTKLRDYMVPDIKKK